MKFKFICCEVLLREACIAIAESIHTVDPEFTPKGAHENADLLRDIIQKKIMATEEAGDYDGVLLGYGLCGNVAEGLKAGKLPLIIPRAHDCCTLFLGSKHKFIEYFKDNLSAEWGSAGYMERGNSYLRETDTGKLLGHDKSYEDLVEQYGEENAQFIWETLHPESHSNELIYIEIPETAHLNYLEKMKTLAEEQGKSVRVLEGNMRLIRGLVNGSWDESEYLVVPPGKTIRAVYDQENVLIYE